MEGTRIRHACLLSLEAVDKNNGWTALMWASHFGHADTVRVLVEHDESLESVDKWVSNALKVAEMSGRQAIAVVVSKEHMTKGGSKSDNQGYGSQ